MHREKMSGVDTAWLRMDRPSNLMQIVGVIIFDRPLDFDRFRRTIQTRLLKHRRFRQSVVQEFTASYWVEDPDFDLDQHIRRVALPGSGTLDDLKTHVSELVSEPLNPARPLWDIQVIESPGGVNAMIMRIHHAIADGIAMVGVILSLTDTCRDAPLETPQRARRNPPEETEDPFWHRILAPVSDAWLGTLAMSGKLWLGYLDMLVNPDKAIGYARMATGFAAELTKLATLPDDSPTRFKGKTGIAKVVAWSEPLPLPAIKAVGNVLGCSVNDLLLAAVAGALRAYLAEKGDATEGVEVRAMVPVNLRPVSREVKLGNHFGLVALELPVGIDNPLQRLFETRRRMEALKHSYQAAVAFGILNVAGMTPRFIQQQALDILANKASAVMTNVPGPAVPLYLAGAEMKQQMFWVPQSGDIGMGVSILSYNNKVQFGLITDRKRVPDPDRIVIRFAREFEKLMLLVLMEPWERLRHPDEVERRVRADLDPQPRSGRRASASS